MITESQKLGNWYNNICNENLTKEKNKICLYISNSKFSVRDDPSAVCLYFGSIVTAVFARHWSAQHHFSPPYLFFANFCLSADGADPLLHNDSGLEGEVVGASRLCSVGCHVLYLDE
jgi:hypothetical protein